MDLTGFFDSFILQNLIWFVTLVILSVLSERDFLKNNFLAYGLLIGTVGVITDLIDKHDLSNFLFSLSYLIISISVLRLFWKMTNHVQKKN